MRALVWCIVAALSLSLTGCRVAGWFLDALLSEPTVLPGQSREDNPTIHPKMLMESTRVPADE